MRPLNTPLNLRRRFWKRVAAATLLGLLLLNMLLPTLLTELLRYQLPRMGLGRVEIGNIDLNLFRGTLRLEGIGLYRSAAQRLYLERAELDLSILALLERRLHIQSLALQGLSLTLEQEGAGKPFTIAGITLPASTETDKAAAPPQPGGWQLGLDSVQISDSAIQLIHPELTEIVALELLSMGPLAMWRPEYITPATLRLALQQGRLAVAASISPFAAEPHHRIDLDLASLPLATFARLAEPTIGGLAGSLSSRMQLQLTQPAGRALVVSQQGSLAVSGLQLRSGGSVLAQQALQWNGQIELADVSRSEGLKVRGELKLDGLTLGGAKGESLTLQGLSAAGVQLQGVSELTLAELAIEGLNATAQRSQSGITLHGLQAVTQGESGAKQETATATGEATAVSSGKPFKLHIERLRLGGENRFTFDDQTVKPPYHQSLTITEADVGPIDTTLPEQQTRLLIKGKDDRYTRFAVEGAVRPFTPQLSVDLKAKLNDFDMPPTSPYLAQLIGYRITTGQLDSEVAMKIEEMQMRGELDLQMNQLKLKAEDPERIEKLQSKTVIPLDTALSLLRDGDDNIRLKMPISGRLDDPQFDLSDIINTALAKSLKLASLSYLKLLLQPYGSLLSVIQVAGKAVGRVRLDPIAFTAGSAELSAANTPYLERLNQLLQKKGVNLRLCGYATLADLVVISKGKEKAIPPQGHPALEALARARAEAIKAALVNGYGASAKQLFICHPELAREEGAEGRVELSL